MATNSSLILLPHELSALVANLANRLVVIVRPVKNPDWYACLSGDCPHDKQAECDASMLSFAPFRPGDTLAVKEKWATAAELDSCNVAQIAEKCLDAHYQRPWCPVEYECGTRENWELSAWGDRGRWRSARSMPLWAVRHFLTVESVRCVQAKEFGKDGRKAEMIKAWGVEESLIEHYRRWFHPDDAPMHAFAHNFPKPWKGLTMDSWLWVYEVQKCD